jgi:hypothetical protein
VSSPKIDQRLGETGRQRQERRIAELRVSLT